MSKENPFLWPIRVYYEDTDAAGVVYHSNYLKYLERARSEWLRTLGYGQEQLFEEEGVRFAVTSMELEFLAPARLDDLLNTSVILTSRRGASLDLDQEITRDQDQKKVFQARMRIVCIDSSFKPTRLPANISVKLLQ